jgi:molecular chaperone DnaJ
MDFNKDYYKELGIDKNASAEEIKKSFKKLSKIHHPDVKNGNEEKFKKINNAYSVLSDSKKKDEYDRNSPHGNSYSPFNSFGNGGFEFSFGGAGDIFSQFFGNGFNPFGQRREEFIENLDIDATTTINLKQIYLNDKINIKFKRFVHCEDCKGTGFDRTGLSDTCEICNGTGKNNRGTCEYCMGEGKIYSQQCRTCKGEKVVLKETEITLQNISKLRSNIRNIHPGYGHQSKYYRDKIGSLILNININRTDDYQVNNNDLHKTINIHFQDAIDGKEIEYTHIDDKKIKIKLPEKSQNNDIIRVKEKGLLKNDNDRADLLLKINIIIDYNRINKK